MWSALERTRTVSAPDTRDWTVRRVMVPRAGRTSPDAEDTVRFDVDADLGRELGPMAAVVTIVVVIAFMVLAPVLPFLVDVFVVLAIGVGMVAARLLFRRPWRIEATAAGTPPEHLAWGVIGTRASAAAIDGIARDITGGVAAGDLRPGVPLTS
jgi:hypothetical protein